MKDYKKFEEQAVINEIEKSLEQIKEYKVNENDKIIDKLKFSDIKHQAR